ncbi:MAG: hypothetical protein ACOCRK_02405 [bacterium]
MAYSNWGGHAYKNGKKIIERSDCQLSGKEIQSTPGIYPGFIHGLDNRSFHVIMGDQDLLIGLYKVDILFIYEDCQKEIIDIIDRDRYSYCIDETKIDNETIEFFNKDKFTYDNILDINYKGHNIQIVWHDDPCEYVTVKMLQNNKDIWIGYSGMYIGAGYYNEKEDNLVENQILDFWNKKIKSEA